MTVFGLCPVRLVGMALFCISAGLDGIASEERAVTAGADASFSPDGRKVLFQRSVGHDIHIGITDLCGGDTIWVWKGEGRAFFPAWAPDGSVVYSYMGKQRTAYAGWKANDGEDGANLYHWCRGERRRLTKGRHFDVQPAISADGRIVYFTSTSPYDMSKPIYRDHPYKEGAVVMSMPLDGTARPVPVTSLTPPMFGLADPQPSPNGERLAIARLDGYFSAWRIVTSSLSVPDVMTYETPQDMVAYSPSWRPDGRAIAFTGYRVGDLGWGAYVKDLKTGTLTRIATGENPSWSPDGQTLIYERDGTVYAKGVR